MLFTFEISKRKNKNGRRQFKMALHEIYPDDVVDEQKEAGTVFNENGITWIREYCEKAAPTIADMSLRCEFLDDDRTEISGHGETGIEDGMPVFRDATEIGHFTKGYVSEVADDDGKEHTIMIGEGYIDEMCYKGFVERLERDAANGELPSGSVEIYRTENNDKIRYKYGYKPEGRIPTEFIYSGYALIGVAPADKQARMLELNNNKEEVPKMNEAEIKKLIQDTVRETNAVTDEISKCKAEYEAKLAEKDKQIEALTSEKNAADDEVEKIKAALEACQKEIEESSKKWDELYNEREALAAKLAEAEANARLEELGKAIEQFSAEEKDYAKAEIEAFKADPVKGEINSVTDKIYSGIGMKARKEEKRIAEQNAEKKNDDIFSEMSPVKPTGDETDIF